MSSETNLFLDPHQWGIQPYFHEPSEASLVNDVQSISKEESSDDNVDDKIRMHGVLGILKFLFNIY